MARNRLPDEVKAQRGTLQKCRTNPHKPKVHASLVPPPPKGLTRRERAEWLAIMPQLDALGIYTEADLAALRLLVASLAIALDPASEEPTQVRIRAMSTSSSLLARFGMDPASRTKVSTVRPQVDENPEEFLFGKPQLVKAG